MDSDGRITYATLEDYDKEALFRVFVEDYDKKYKVDEYETRFETFKTFLDLCDARNMAEANSGGSGVHGITMFADLVPSEFEAYLGYVATSSTVDIEYYDGEEYTGELTSVDWTDVYTTPVKDQGYCGRYRGSPPFFIFFLYSHIFLDL